MSTHRSIFVALTIFALSAIQLTAGTLFYVPISATQSDAGSGISSDNAYTSAVDGGNTRGTDRVINGITLYALAGSGQSSTADNCTLNVLSGTLTNGGGKAGSIQADGVIGDALSDTTFNAGATDNSQQEIVLDPEGLESGTTYDLRIYICNSSGQNRQVNLSFVGDGQPAVETGLFNEDDARTSRGGFKDANQVYYINYRFTWDGDSTPGVTITQKSGSAPFCLYALTNQVASAGGAATSGEGMNVGLVEGDSDEVGVASDDFYESESLNSNGRWVELDKWGKCWQPTSVPNGWCPYTNGTWRECDDCGWTFISDEPWAWCCYHYGRWSKTRTGCGWVWVPGKVWAASWVSWRKGRDESCSCVGWAPLPPEASCRVGVGISTSVDRTCDIGPDCYTFVNVRDFGSDSYFGCGCIYERPRNVTIIIETINITNIFFDRHVTYCGGPDFNWCNERIRKFGGKEITKIYINHFDDPKKSKGGKFSQLEGNQLALLTPHVKGDKNPKHAPKVTEHLGADKIDKGWGNVKDKKLEKQLRNHIAEETKGKTPKTDKATLPNDVADKIKKHHGGQGGSSGSVTAGATDQHPGGKKHKEANGGTSTTGASNTGTFDQHPGSKGHKNKKEGSPLNTNAATNVGGTQTSTTGGTHDKHPGQSNKKKLSGGEGAGGSNKIGNAGTGNATDVGTSGKTTGKKHHKTGQSQNTSGGSQQNSTQSQTGQTGLQSSGGGGGKHHHQGQSQNQQLQQNGTQGNVGGNTPNTSTQQLQSNQQQQHHQGGKHNKGNPTATPH